MSTASQSLPIRYLLDTNICIYVINARAAAVLARLCAHDLGAARKYGELRAYLEQQGTPMGSLDQQIASHALALDIRLVTHNVREFERVPWLRLENWI